MIEFAGATDGVGECSLVGTEPHGHDERLVLLCLDVSLVCWACGGVAVSS